MPRVLRGCSVYPCRPGSGRAASRPEGTATAVEAPMPDAYCPATPHSKLHVSLRRPSLTMDEVTSMTSACSDGHRPPTRDGRAPNAAVHAHERPPGAEDRAPFVSLATDLLTVIGRDGSFQRLGP